MEPSPSTSIEEESMRRGAPRALLVGGLGIAVLVLTSLSPQTGLRTAHADVLAKLDPRLRAHVSGTASLELEPGGPAAARQTMRSNYFPVGDDGCPVSQGRDVKVNVNCLNVADPNLQGRSQAQNETAIAVSPDGQHLIASYNDYRRGDGSCGVSYSLDGGARWADSAAPMSFSSGAPFGAARQYWQAGGDTSVAWDTRGNAYLSCQVFNRGAPPTTNPDLSSAFLVFRSTHNNGASWDFPGR